MQTGLGRQHQASFEAMFYDSEDQDTSYDYPVLKNPLPLSWLDRWAAWTAHIVQQA
jgi:hypothetical protein